MPTYPCGWPQWGTGIKGTSPREKQLKPRLALEPKLLREDEEWSSRGTNGTGRSAHYAKTWESGGRARWAQVG